jgi:hypothetical protein
MQISAVFQAVVRVYMKTDEDRRIDNSYGSLQLQICRSVGDESAGSFHAEMQKRCKF